MTDQAEAEAFAAEWIAAWNAHDLPRVLSHYRDDFQMSSPHILEYGGEPSGMLEGKAAVGAYWRTALERNPGLHFELEAVLLGVRGLTILYRTGLRRAADVLEFDEDGQIVRGAAYYLKSLQTSPITPTV